MRSFLTEIILDFQDMPLLTGVPRQLSISSIPQKATVCIGVRRCGKSTYLFQLIQSLIDTGIPKEDIIYINFFDDRLFGMQREHLAQIMEAYFSLYPGKNGQRTIHCFFDEIQMVEGWESFVERLLRSGNYSITITGSSAQMLSKELATQMRGRALAWEIFPFSFSEYLRARSIDSALPLSSKRRYQIQHAFDTYWEAGGFPECVELHPRVRRKVHQEYFGAMLFRDLIERHDISHPKAILDLAHWLANNVGALYSINRLTGYIQSLGHKVPKQLISNYMQWFEDAYVFFTVRLFDASVTRANRNPKKVYCIDHALAKSVSTGILVNAGHLLENLVFCTLRRKTSEVYYYKTKTNKEVDFIILLPDGGRALIQVCESMKEPATNKREISAMTHAMAEQNMQKGYIVTRSEADTLDVQNGKIRILPVWKFMLEMDTGTFAK